MNLEIHKNFLDKDFFLNFKKIIIDQDFPWRFREKMTEKNNNFFFTYSFFNQSKINSEFYEIYIIPILQKLNCKSPIQIRANLNLKNNNGKSGWHVDYDYLCKTAILYLNTCNGGTELQLKNKKKFIKSEENKIIIFDSNTKHRGIIQTNTLTRYFLNLNYFK